MNTTISNNGLPKFTQATGSSGSGPSSAGANPPDATAGSPKADDQVRLTDSALALQQAARAGDAPVIDSQRVERLRQALADGSYKIDAGRIADRMLALEQQLGGTGKA